MRWREGKRSSNVEDRRGRGLKSGAKIGGGAVILALLAGLLLGEDPGRILEMISGGGGASPAVEEQAPPANDEEAEFVARLLGDTEVVWGEQFAAAGAQYPQPSLVLYTDAVESACGINSAATGPFYCPGDRKVYLDLSFLGELRRLGAPGDFAFAYVVAHEVGHHVQTVTGTEQEVRQLQQRMRTQEQINSVQVAMELQADCYAGVWAHHTQIPLEEGDIEEGLGAAAAVGDDRLQRMAGRRVQPEAFTHGSSEQRVSWFRRGLQSGEYGACDTFETN